MADAHGSRPVMPSQTGSNYPSTHSRQERGEPVELSQPQVPHKPANLMEGGKNASSQRSHCHGNSNSIYYTSDRKVEQEKVSCSGTSTVLDRSQRTVKSPALVARAFAV